MPEESSKLLSEHPFWVAVHQGDTARAKGMLLDEPWLANRDFRAVEDQDPHTRGFPLVEAAINGDLDMMALLIDSGADIDAKSPTEEQRELGAPIMLAWEAKRHDVIHFLLDRGASVAAYGWCYASLVDLVLEDALRNGGDTKLARKGFDRYLGPSEPVSIPQDAHESILLLNRLLELGGQPSVGAVAEFKMEAVAEQLLHRCPNEPSTRHDCPPGTVFESLCWSAGWHGIPSVLDLAMRCCPDLYDKKMAVEVLRSAIISHNRIGFASDYFRLIETQLQFLRDRGEIQSIIQEPDFSPHILLADNYLWPGWYGHESEPSSAESMIELSRLFTRYGFTDFQRVDSESGETALERARSRSDHPGLGEFADYLVSVARGGLRGS